MSKFVKSIYGGGVAQMVWNHGAEAGAELLREWVASAKKDDLIIFARVVGQGHIAREEQIERECAEQEAAA